MLLKDKGSDKLADTIVISAQNVWKKFKLYHEKNRTFKETLLRRQKASFEEFWALKGISFEVEKGETVGLIGENGSGKSTALKLLTHILQPDKGEINHKGKISALLELGAGFHPELTGRENVYLNSSMLGMTNAETSEKFDEIVRFAELEKFIDTPVKNYSSGMYIRLGFAVAVNVNPDILLVDEVLAVGDEFFQRKCFDKFYQFKDQGKTIIFVSHALDTVRKFCDKTLWLDGGEIVACGKTSDVIDEYLKSVNEHEEKEKENLAAKKWGSKEIEITDVKVLDSSGNERLNFENGECMILRISYYAKTEIDNPVFGIAIFNKAGVYCYGVNTGIDNIHTGMINGSGSVYFQCPSLNFLSDSYMLDVAVYDKHLIHPYDFHNKAYSFNLRSAKQDEGIFLVPHKWEFQC